MTTSYFFDTDDNAKIEFASLASDMRILGFNESTIESWLSRIWTIEEFSSIKEAVVKYKLHADLYGDSQE